MSDEKAAAPTPPDAPKVDADVPEGAKGETENVSKAREKFQASVKKFITEANKHSPFDSDTEKLLGEISNSSTGTLPKRPDDKVDDKVADKMVIVQKKIAEKQALDKKKSEEEIAAAAAAFKPIIDEARTAHTEYEKATVAEKKQESAGPNAIQPSFLDAQGKDNKMHKIFISGSSVTATDKSIESFRTALDVFKGEKGERAFTNVSLISPPVDREKLLSNVQYRNNVHERILETLKADLMPANDIEMMMQALSTPSNTARQWRLFPGAIPRALGLNALDMTDKIPPLFDRPDAKLRDRQMKSLEDAVGEYKQRHAAKLAGQTPKDPGVNAQADVQTQNKAAPKPGDPATADHVSITMKPKIGG